MKTYFIVILLLFSFSAWSQKGFQDISFAQALGLAQKSGKLILIQVEALDCEMCNYVALKGLKHEEVSKKMEEEFIVIRVDAKEEDRAMINILYDLDNSSYCSLFVDGNKNLVHRYDGTTSYFKTYLEEFGTARFRQSEVMKLDILAESYNKFKTNDHLERWIWAKSALNLHTDSLLNLYANNLAADSLNSERVLEFIMRQSPLYGSAADTIARRNPLFEKAWSAIPLAERIVINKKIIAKSMQKAIQDKDDQYGYKVAYFSWAIYGEDRKAGMLSFNQQSLKYFEGVKKMYNYIAYAIVNFDSVLLKTTVADVLVKDSLRRIASMKNAKTESVLTESGKRVEAKSFSFSPGGQYYTNTLNRAAWFIYQNTDSIPYLNRALEWVRKGNEYSEKFEAIDTEARLLYKLGRRKEAIELMEKAIAIKNEKMKMSDAFVRLDTVLKNMKEGKDVIDVK